MSDPLNFETKEQYNAVLDAYKTGKYDKLAPASKELIGRSLVQFKERYESDETFRAVTNFYRGPVNQRPSPDEMEGMGWGAEFGPVLTEGADSNERLLRQATEQGYDIKTGAPQVARLIYGALSFDPETATLAVENYLRQSTKAPAGIPVLATEPNTGYLAYLRTVTDDDIKAGSFPKGSEGKYVYTLFNPSGIDRGDVTEYLPSLPADVAELAAAGMVGKAASTGAKALFGTAALSGVIQGLSVPLKKKLAAELGVPQEILDENDTLDSAISEAIFASGGDLAVGLAGKSIKAMRAKGRFIRPEQMAELADRIRTMAAIRKDVLDATGVDVPMTVGESTGLTQLLIQEANIRGRLRGKARVEEEANVIESQEAVGRALRIFSDNAADAHVPGPYGRVTAHQDDLGKAAAGVVRAPAVAAKAELQAAEQKLSDEMGKIPETWDPAPFVAMRQNVDNLITEGKIVEEGAWNNFNNLIRVNPTSGLAEIMVTNGQNSPVMKALGKLKREQINDLFGKTQEGTKKLIEGLTAKYKLDKEAGVLLRTKFGLNDALIDIRSLHILRSNLDQLERDIIASSEGAVGWSRNQVITLRNAVDQQLREAPLVDRAGNALDDVAAGTIREAYDTASAISLRQKNLLENEGIMAIVKADPMFDDAGKITGYRFRDSPEKFTQKIMDDPSLMYRVLEITGQSPEVRAAMGNELLRRAKIASFNPETNAFQRGKWNEFVQQHYSQMRLALGEEGAARATTSVLALDAAVKSAQKNATKVEAIIKEAYGAKFADLKPGQYPTSIIEDALENNSTFTAEQVGRLVADISRQDPALGAQLRKSAGDWVVTTLTQRKNVTSSDAIRKLIERQGARLEAVFGAKGPQYIKDLQKLEKIMEGLEKGNKVSSIPQERATWLQLTRNFFGPLSSMQRYLTTGERYGKIYEARKGMNMLRDPSKLHQFMMLENLPLDSYARRVVMARLGIEEATGDSSQDVSLEPSLSDQVKYLIDKATGD